MAHYYVDASNGSDANNGLSEQGYEPDGPWATLDKVNATTFDYGDIISFKRGCTWEGQLHLTHAHHSGTAGDPITFNAYGTGTNPVFTARTVYVGHTGWSQPHPDTHPSVWSKAAPPGYDPPDMALQYDHAPSYNNYRATRLYPPNTYANLNQAERWLLADIDDEKVIHIFHYGGAPGVDSVIQYYESVLIVDGASYINIDNLIIQGGERNVWIKGGTENGGETGHINVTNVVSRYGTMNFHCMGETGAKLTDVTLTGCQAFGSKVSHGFKVGSDSSPTGTTVSDITFDACLAYENRSTGFAVGRSSNATLTQCISRSNTGAFWPTEGSYGFRFGSTQTGLMDGCTSHNNASFGVCLEKSPTGATPTDITIQNCLIYDNGYGVTLKDLAADSYLHVYNNTIVDNGGSWGGGVVLGDGDSGGSTCLAGDVEFKNNILVNTLANGYLVWRYGSEVVNMVAEDNIYWNSGQTGWNAFARENGGAGNTYTFAAWQTYMTDVSCQEAGTSCEDPLFSNAAGHDFTLAYSSPGIDGCSRLTGVTSDLDGTPRDDPDDIGCYHY
jgi:hypothetical protein